MRGGARLGVACGVLLLTLVIFSQAGPVNRSSRMLGVEGISQVSDEETLVLAAIPGDNVTDAVRQEGCNVSGAQYQAGAIVPGGGGPCDRCTCSGGSVTCTPLQCEARPGCKALHRADHCCPLYQCECERNGKLYSNGEKLVELESPCQVCYCQGGEIVCNRIACFSREDCEPRYVAGRCCPEYDHCPPRDMENHIQTKDVTSKPDIENKEPSTSYLGFTEDFKTSTDKTDEIRDSVKNIEHKHHGKPLTTTSESNDNNASSDSNESQSDAVISNETFDKKNDIPSNNINIKEVTQANEIRIKEILPVANYEASQFSTKSPTIPREATYTEESSSRPELDGESKKALDTNLNSESKPPVLRIGDQLYVLEHGGDLVPENSALSTPSSVFTVIGAEGLQRVVEDPEEPFDSKNEISTDENDDTPNTTETSEASYGENILNLTLASIDSSEIKDSDNVSSNEESGEEIIREVMSELYQTTTEEPATVKKDDDADFVRNDYLTNNVIVKQSSEADSVATESISEFINYSGNSDDQQKFEEKSSPEHPLDEEQLMIPIEHLPEHNPEYPPIPDEIMSPSMTEDTLESGFSELEFSGVSSLESQENKEEVKKILVKRPVNPMSYPKQKNNNIFKEANAEKILPDILHFVKVNKTNDTESPVTLIPEDWLKATEKPVEVNSPLINLSLSIPDIILLSESDKDASSESEDEVNEYIFPNNDTAEIKLNSAENNKIEVTTDDPTSLTDGITLDAEFRSPGEPYLIPEWERNQTTESPEATTKLIDNNSSEDESDEFQTENANIVTSEVPISESVESSEEKQDYKESVSESVNISTERSDIENNVDSTPVTTTENDEPSISSDPSTVYQDLLNRVDEGEITTESASSQINDVSSAKISTSSPAPVLTTSAPVDLNRETEVIQFSNPQSDNHTKKLKKDPSSNKDNDLPKSRNSLADLISFIGDFASMGNSDEEVSTVHNSIDAESPRDVRFKQDGINNSPMFTKELTTVPNNMRTKTELPAVDTLNVEFSEYPPTEEKSEVDNPQDNGKVELTTRKTYIDNDSDERNKWKSTDDIIKDIEIIPKVGNKVSKKNPSKEKIIDDLESATKQDESKKIIIDQPAQTTVSVKETTTRAPQKINKEIKLETADTNEDVIIYTTVKPGSPVTQKIKPEGKKVQKANSSESNQPARSAISTKVINVTTLLPKQKSITNPDTSTEGPSFTSTVMKVSSKIPTQASEDEIQSNDPDVNGKDKLKKRETNLQSADDYSPNIDESLLSIIRDFYRKQYRH